MVARVEDDALAGELASSGHRLAGALLRACAASGTAEVRRGSGWLAVRTRAASNDLNGVLSETDALVTPALVADLRSWFEDVDAPASWRLATPDPRSTETLVAAGALPERTGRWSGCRIPAADLGSTRGEITVHPVATAPELDLWLDIASVCEWFADDEDRLVRRRLYLALGLADGPLTHWLGRFQGEPAGFASSQVQGDVVGLGNLGVLPALRRRGVGRALVGSRCDHGRKRGARLVVTAPSPDGWSLQRSLGFTNVPVEPDVCFYLPLGG